jgi:hypothetical protein
VAVYEIPDFRKLKGDPQLVTVVTSDEIDKFLGARDRHERECHLSDLRERGLIFTNKGRTFQQTVRRTPMLLAYVFRGPASRVPKIGKGHMAGRVRTWH